MNKVGLFVDGIEMGYRNYRRQDVEFELSVDESLGTVTATNVNAVSFMHVRYRGTSIEVRVFSEIGDVAIATFPLRRHVEPDDSLIYNPQCMSIQLF